MSRDEFLNTLCAEALRMTPEAPTAFVDFVRAYGETIYDPDLVDRDRKQIQEAIRAFDQMAAILHRFVDYHLLGLRDITYGKGKL